MCSINYAPLNMTLRRNDKMMQDEGAVARMGGKKDGVHVKA